NEQGYLGASVDKISARLNVTKGSFYHHNEAKDDLVVACFQRTLDVMRQTQRQAILAGGDGWRRTASAAMALIHRQATHTAPLLRTSALTSTPEPMQRALVAEFDRVSLTFASTVSDGIADGSIRPVDAHIAAQALTAAINAAAELEYWAPGASSQAAAEAYARALLTGVGTFLS
ncbi:MAG: TetR/AcrR family transcriptional regulator, partial [Caulobacteraceae bacterium]